MGNTKLLSFREWLDIDTVYLSSGLLGESDYDDVENNEENTDTKESIMEARCSTTPETIDTLSEKLKKMGYDQLKRLTTKKIAILTTANRIEVLNNVAKKFKATYYNDSTKGSSVGYVQVGNIVVVAKPLAKQGAGSAGVNNEKIFINGINALCKTGPINIKITDGKKSFLAIGVTQCLEAGRNTTGKKKADAVLKSKEKSYPISIKQDNAAFWENGSTFVDEQFKRNLDAKIKSGEIEISKRPDGKYRLSQAVAWKCTPKEKEAAMFGSDIKPNGCIIEKTFSSKFYTIDKDGTMVIQVTKILTSTRDATGPLEAWNMIRNDVSHNNKRLGYPGLRAFVAYQKALSSKVVKI